MTFLEKHVHLHGRLCGACSQVKEFLLEVAQKDKAIFELSRAYDVMVSETNEAATEASRANFSDADEEIRLEEKLAADEAELRRKVR